MARIAADEFGTLMAKAQGGDRISYERLLVALIPVLRASIRTTAPRIPLTDVEDLVQETLLSIHHVRATYDPMRPFGPWMHAIARNRTVDWLRKRRRNAAFVSIEETNDETFVDDDAKTTEELVADRDALGHAMATLPHGQRRAVELLKLKEMTLQEASVQSGVSVAALKVACHRAIKALRSAMVSDH